MIEKKPNKNVVITGVVSTEKTIFPDNLTGLNVDRIITIEDCCEIVLESENV